MVNAQKSVYTPAAVEADAVRDAKRQKELFEELKNAKPENYSKIFSRHGMLREYRYFVANRVDIGKLIEEYSKLDEKGSGQLQKQIEYMWKRWGTGDAGKYTVGMLIAETLKQGKSLVDVGLVFEQKVMEGKMRIILDAEGKKLGWNVGPTARERLNVHEERLKENLGVWGGEENPTAENKEALKTKPKKIIEPIAKEKGGEEKAEESEGEKPKAKKPEAEKAAKAEKKEAGEGTETTKETKAGTETEETASQIFGTPKTINFYELENNSSIRGEVFILKTTLDEMANDAKSAKASAGFEEWMGSKRLDAQEKIARNLMELIDLFQVNGREDLITKLGNDEAARKRADEYISRS